MAGPHRSAAAMTRRAELERVARLADRAVLVLAIIAAVLLLAGWLS